MPNPAQPRSLEDEFPPIKWGDPPPRTPGPGRNPGMTKMIEDDIEKLMARPGEWGLVRVGVEKGKQSARPYERRGCLTQVAHTPGDGKLWDVYAMWPFIGHPDSIERFTPPVD